MTVIVKLHRSMRATWMRFVRSLPGDAAERNRTARAWWDEFVQTIVDAQGPPEGAVAESRYRSAYWCGFPGGALVLVQFRKPEHTGLFRWSLTALALKMNFSPGLPG